MTLAGLGESSDANIEILVETKANDPNVALVLNEIDSNKIVATEEMALAILKIANSLNIENFPQVDNFIWVPHSRRPELSYKLYVNPPTENVIQADRVLLNDLAMANLPPNLIESEFKLFFRGLLKNFSLANEVLNYSNDTIVTFGKSHTYFEEFSDDNFSSHDLWLAFVSWMAYFFPNDVMEHHIIEIALRRAQLLT